MNIAGAMLRATYPKEVSTREFEQALEALRAIPEAKAPNLSVVYQTVGGETVRLLCVGGMDRCARVVVETLDEHPDFSKIDIWSEFIHVSPTRLGLY